MIICPVTEVVQWRIQKVNYTRTVWRKKRKKKPEHKVYCRLDTLAIKVAIKLWGLGNAWG